jgi:hypothetical protein
MRPNVRAANEPMRQDSKHTLTGRDIAVRVAAKDSTCCAERCFSLAPIETQLYCNFPHNIHIIAIESIASTNTMVIRYVAKN